MHKPATALSALLVLCVLVLAACGGSGTTSTKTATLPGGTLGNTVVSPTPGTYAGMECTDFECSHFTDAFARTQVLASCKNGRPVKGQPTSFTFRGNDEYFVCFTLQDAELLVYFYAAGEHIIRSVPVKGDEFPLTCDQDWCISGKWSTDTKMTGEVRNPNGLTTKYAAEWVKP